MGGGITLKKSNDVYFGAFEDAYGKYSISAVRPKGGRFEGTFAFEPSEKGRSDFYEKDDGRFILEKSSKKKYENWKKLYEKQMLGYGNKASMEKIAKHSPRVRARLAKYRAMIKKSNVPIKFYGKVVDQFAEPIGNADVECHVDYDPLVMWTNRTKIYHLKTNAKGMFVLESNGSEVSVNRIEKTGYRPLSVANIPSDRSSFAYSMSSRIFIPAPNHPVVFVLSKITEKAPYLVVNDREFMFK